MSSLELFNTEYTTSEKLIDLSKRLEEPEWLLNRRLKFFTEYEKLPYDQDVLFYKYTTFRKFDPKTLTSMSEGSDNVFDEIDGIDPSIIESENGVVSHLSEELLSQGIFFGTLHDLLNKDPELAKNIIERADQVSTEFDKLGSLAKAFAVNTIILYVPKGVIVEGLLTKLSILEDKPVAFFTEFIGYFCDDSQVSFAETFLSSVSNSSKEKLFAMSQTLILGDNTKVTSTQVQNWDETTVHIVAKIAAIGRYSTLRSLTHLQGAHMSRHNSHLELIGQGSEGYDLFIKFGHDRQRFDIKSELHHNGVDTIGNVHARTVMMNRAESILRGLIVIPESGVNADSWLTSQGMTMGKGKIVAIPALKIDQNDVKAAHAASVEPINQELIFYLTTRGISSELSRELLVKGYFEYILKQINNNEMVELSRKYLTEKWELIG